VELGRGTCIADRYEVEQPLGRGGMGTVVQVRDRTTGTRRALKLLPRVDDGLRRRLLREGRLQGGVDHPGVVGVVDLIEVDDHPALVLELVPGGRTLAHRLAEGPVPRDEVDHLAESLFAAVAAAHARGLVHRDLKPANILLDTGDDGPVPRITDFGLAKLLGDHGSVATATGALLGTPAYMAPEQVQDPRSVDARADLFSLAAVLYELLSGQRAFPGAPTEAMWRAARGEAEPLDDDGPRAAAIHWALAPFPEDRPADVDALRQAWRGQRSPPPRAPDTWALPPSSVDAPCPDPDELVHRAHDPAIAAHLDQCAACRIDRRLYAEFTSPPSPWPARGYGALGFAAGVLATLALATMVLGRLADLAHAGPFLLPLLLLPGLGLGWLAHAMASTTTPQPSLLRPYLVPAGVLAVGAVATAAGAEQALGAIATAPPEHVRTMAGQAAHIALSTWTIGYAAGLVLVAVPPAVQVLRARDRATDPGFDPAPVVLGVAGAAGLWLAEGSAAGLLAFAATTAMALLLALWPRQVRDAPSQLVVALGAALWVAVVPVAARVERLRRAVVTDEAGDAFQTVVDGWSLGWALLALALGLVALRPGPAATLRRAIDRRRAAELVALLAIAGIPTWWTVVRMRQLGEVLTGP